MNKGEKFQNHLKHWTSNWLRLLVNTRTYMLEFIPASLGKLNASYGSELKLAGLTRGKELISMN